MKTKKPLISCLCVTRDNPDLLSRAISCFLSQTYSNKELIIVYENDDNRTINYLETITWDCIKKVLVKKSTTVNLGELRNIAINNASGDYVCQWDDDDWYHIGRLEYQYEVAKYFNKRGSILRRWIVFDHLKDRAYVSNERMWEGSVLCEKDVIQSQTYANLTKGEDTGVVEYLSANNYLFPISSSPNVYIYVYHGENTWDYKHWSLIFRASDELSKQDSKTIKEILEGKYTNEKASLFLDQITDSPFFHA